MSHYRPWVGVCVGLIAALCFAPCHAGQLQLTLYLNTSARQFLNNSSQSILIVIPNPASEAGNTVVAMTLPPPIADSMTLIIETDANLYVTNGAIASVDVITTGVASPASYGNAYSFNGVQINGDGSGQAGTVGIYYNTPPNAQALITGLALFIYDSAQGKPATPSPINAYTLNRFQSRYISQPTAVLWALVGGGINASSVLPSSLFKPVSASTSFANASSQAVTSFQLSRYLEVPFNAQNQASIHFDTTLNAFAPGPYP